MIKLNLKRIKKIYAYFRTLCKWLFLFMLRKLFLLLPIKKNKIVFDNFFGNGYGDNVACLATEILLRKEKFDMVWFVKSYDIRLPEGIRKVKYGSIKSIYEAATAKVWIDNVRNAHLIKKKKGQVYLQTWHSGFACKKVEKEAEEQLSKEYIEAAKYDGKITDGILVSNGLQKQRFCKSFWLNKEADILCIGIPRNDILMRARNENYFEKYRNKYKISTDKYVVLYAPSFRDDNSLDGYRLDFKGIIKTIKNRTGKDVILMIRLHPNVSWQSNFIEYNNEIINATKYENFQELAIISDCLITDFSSTVYDFMLLRKPIFSCVLDYESYNKTNRGLRKEYYKLPFQICLTNEALIKTISHFDVNKYNADVEKCLEKMDIYDVGDASKRAVDWIYKKIFYHRYL